MSASMLTPLHDRIVVRRIEEAQTTPGGIIIPDSAREKSQIGEVVAIGKGKRNDKGEYLPLEVKVGDRVMFGKYAGSDTPRGYYESEGQELVVMREEEIYGIIGATAKGAKK